jgi:hypothetical protein
VAIHPSFMVVSALLMRLPGNGLLSGRVRVRVRVLVLVLVLVDGWRGGCWRTRRHSLTHRMSMWDLIQRLIYAWLLLLCSYGRCHLRRRWWWWWRACRVDCRGRG